MGLTRYRCSDGRCHEAKPGSSTTSCDAEHMLLALLGRYTSIRLCQGRRCGQPQDARRLGGMARQSRNVCLKPSSICRAVIALQNHVWNGVRPGCSRDRTTGDVPLVVQAMFGLREFRSRLPAVQECGRPAGLSSWRALTVIILDNDEDTGEAGMGDGL